MFIETKVKQDKTYMSLDQHLGDRLYLFLDDQIGIYPLKSTTNSWSLGDIAEECVNFKIPLNSCVTKFTDADGKDLSYLSSKGMGKVLDYTFIVTGGKKGREIMNKAFVMSLNVNVVESVKNVKKIVPVEGSTEEEAKMKEVSEEVTEVNNYIEAVFEFELPALKAPRFLH